MNVYIACGLTHVPRNEFTLYVSFIHELAEHLTQEGCAEVKYALKDSDPQLAEKPFEERAHLCYLWDRRMVEEADLVVAEATYPSTGLGIELQLAESKGIPTVICFNSLDSRKAEPAEYETTDYVRHSLQVGEGFVSLMALGLPTVLRVVPYTHRQQAFREVGEAVRVLRSGFDIKAPKDKEA